MKKILFFVLSFMLMSTSATWATLQSQITALGGAGGTIVVSSETITTGVTVPDGAPITLQFGDQVALTCDPTLGTGICIHSTAPLSFIGTSGRSDGELGGWGSRVISGTTSLSIGATAVTRNSSGVVTLTLSSSSGFTVGERIITTGISDSSVNGDWSLGSIPDGTHITFTTNDHTAIASTGNGTVYRGFKGTLVKIEAPDSTSSSWYGAATGASDWQIKGMLFECFAHQGIAIDTATTIRDSIENTEIAFCDKELSRDYFRYPSSQSIFSMTRASSGEVTVNLNTNGYWTVGQEIVVDGYSTSSYNGKFTVTFVGSRPTSGIRYCCSTVSSPCASGCGTVNSATAYGARGLDEFSRLHNVTFTSPLTAGILLDGTGTDVGSRTDTQGGSFSNLNWDGVTCTLDRPNSSCIQAKHAQIGNAHIGLLKVYFNNSSCLASVVGTGTYGPPSCTAQTMYGIRSDADWISTLIDSFMMEADSYSSDTIDAFQGQESGIPMSSCGSRWYGGGTCHNPTITVQRLAGVPTPVMLLGQ